MLPNKLICSLLLSSLSCIAYAQDISGIWQNIDDKTGSPKGVIEIRKENDGTFTGTVVKVTPRSGYTPRTTCVDCPAPYTNKAILALMFSKA